MRIYSPSAASAVLHIADALGAAASADVRADSKGRALSPEGVLWAAYAGRIAEGGHAAAAARLAGIPRAHRLGVRADSMYLAGDLVDRASTATTVPQRPNAIAAAIPVDRITPYAESWTAVTSEDNGMASAYRLGQRDVNQVGYSLSETVLPVQMFAIDVVEHFGAAQQRQIAQSEAARAAGSQAEQMRRATYAHLRAHNALLVEGLDGFGGKSLADLDVYRATANATFDGDAANADDALSEVMRLIQYIPEKSEGSAPAPNTLIVPRAPFNALTRSPNFEAGGPGLAMQAVRSILDSEGISQVIFADELSGKGKDGGDLAIFFNRDDPTSLKQKLGIAPAPALTFDREGDRVTRILSSSGGLWSENGAATLLATLPTS
jgi:hypothetical protein